MLKLAARIFDVYDDLETMTIGRTVAGKVGSVSVAPPDVIDGLRDAQFGLILKTAGGPTLRRYPLHDASATKLSRAYFDSPLAPELPAELRARVELKLKAAEQCHKIADHAIPPEIANELNEMVVYADAEKLELPKTAAWEPENECWGLTVGDRNYFPLHTKELVKTAEARFAVTAAGLQPHERFLYARNIEKQAAKLGVEIDPSSPIHNYTSPAPNPAALKTAIAERRRILLAEAKSTRLLDELEKAADTIDPSRAIQLLQGIDAYAGISNEHYLKGLPDPYAACFKCAAAMPPTWVDGVDLAKIPGEALRDKFDEEFVREFKKDPVGTYSHLPNPIKELIRSLYTPEEKKPEASPANRRAGDPLDLLAANYSNGGAGLVY